MIDMTARNFKLTEGITNHVNSKLSKFEKFLNENERMNVVLESNKYGKKAEVSFRLASKPLRASVVDDDLYVAVDLLVDKLNKIIKKHNGKDSKKDSIRYAETISKSEEYARGTMVNQPSIVKRKTVPSKPMFEEEAIEQMELLDHRSFIFHNESTGTVCMMYKRNDGNYGILETE